jgi:hypothetical protein
MDMATFGPLVVIVDDASTVMWSIVPVDVPPLARLRAARRGRNRRGRVLNDERVSVPDTALVLSAKPASQALSHTVTVAIEEADWPSRTQELS